MATLSVSTTLLYGVYVSEKSHLIGIRCLVKREHSKMLAAKVAGHLPQELTDLIERNLYELEEGSVRARWVRNSPHHNQVKFQYRSMATEAEVAVCRKLDALGVATTVVHNTKPEGGRGRSPRYVHLSALKILPSISLTIPPIANKKTLLLPSFASGLPYAGNQGAIRVILEGSPSRKSDKAIYTPMVRESLPTLRLQPSVGRILSLDGLEAAMRDWDPVALRTYVRLLNLHVVAEAEECPETALRPKVQIWQQIDDV